MSTSVLLLTLSCALTPLRNGHLGEVIGASGRIGSLLLRAGRGDLAAVPRGVAPGALSPPGTPIIVATPASALGDVLRSTPRCGESFGSSNCAVDLQLLPLSADCAEAGSLLAVREQHPVFHSKSWLKFPRLLLRLASCPCEER